MLSDLPRKYVVSIESSFRHSRYLPRPITVELPFKAYISIQVSGVYTLQLCNDETPAFLISNAQLLHRNTLLSPR